MIDLILGWAVVILPTLFALAIEVVSESIRKNKRWRWGVIAFGVALSSLTFWQQHRTVVQAGKDRGKAIDDTANRVAKQTTENITLALAKQYGTTIKEMATQLAEQGKKVETIGQSDIVTGKKPVAVVITNSAPTGGGGEPQPDIHIARLSATPNPQYGKNAVKFILTTNRIMNGGRVVVTCTKGKINRGDEEIMGTVAPVGGGDGGVQDEHTYISGISTPNWSPDFPLLITLYYDAEDLGVCSFRPLK